MHNPFGGKKLFYCSSGCATYIVQRLLPQTSVIISLFYCSHNNIRKLEKDPFYEKF
jgi:hypothetical protein